ncbi:hypothetical protein HHX47_DHR1001995 [Lentinula edodes]|nr:hypothetical protein HHX47_DHR1001995 [Lentinula edodes]
MWSLFVLFALGLLLGTHAYDGSRYDNVVAYWGQNSYGATHTDVVNYQQRIGYYCGDDAVDVFPVAFVDIFFSTGGLPSMNLANVGSVINVVAFDAIYVQFYDNPCGLPFFETTTWNFGVWDNWARTTSPNPNVKVFLGAPAASHAAGTGYQDLATLSSYAVQMRQSFPSFGGVMLWDESQAYVNDRYDLGIKNALVAAGGTGFTFPACSAPAYVAGTAYSGGSKVSYDGYIYEAKYYADDVPSNDPNGDWSAISACSGAGGSSSTSSSATKTTTSTSQTTTTVTSTTTSASSSPTSGSCAGIAAWTSSVAYAGGSQVTYK